jgi:NTP pyrophosphatase (non-canonical NTP hydrolase)
LVRKLTNLNTFLNEYTKQATQGLFILPHIDPITHCALKLAGEAGEIADAVGKTHYNPPKLYNSHDLGLELGDVMWYVTNLAQLHNYTLEQVLYMNIDKLAKRHAGKGVYDVSKL